MLRCPGLHSAGRQPPPGVASERIAESIDAESEQAWHWCSGQGEAGGGTAFPELKLEVAPQQGSAIVFNDCFDNGEEDGRSLHAGLPPANPGTVKYAINGWIRSEDRTSWGSMF